MNADKNQLCLLIGVHLRSSAAKMQKAADALADACGFQCPA
jgi:Holliday junction resolvasome RuvABC endonuclease subunit